MERPSDARGQVVSAKPMDPQGTRLDKKRAIRHLIHAAIRLVMKQENPYAIHLIIHSADKMILDLAKKRGIEITIDWQKGVSQQRFSQFISQERAIYNYLKHADKDSFNEAPVRDIMIANIKTICSASINYATLFSEQTDHMTCFLIFVVTLLPGVRLRPGFSMGKNLSDVPPSTTPKDFFAVVKDAFPSFEAEAIEDLKDVEHFYSCSFSDIRARTRRMRLRLL